MVELEQVFLSIDFICKNMISCGKYKTFVGINKKRRNTKTQNATREIGRKGGEILRTESIAEGEIKLGDPKEGGG